VSDELLRKLAGSEEQYRLIAQAGVRSIMVQPVIARGETVALLTLIFTSESGRRYDRDDPELSHEFALHAAYILENARLVKDLRASDDRFRVALAGARTLVFEQDPSLRYMWIYDPLVARSVVGKTDDEAFPPQDAAVLNELKRRALERGENVQREIALTKEGLRRQLREVVEPKRNRAGKIVGIIGSATDITDEKRVQRELSDAISLRDQMVGILSHDLRNPLGAVTMGAEALRRMTDLPEPAQKSVATVANAAARMREMIDTLLDFTRMRAQGKLPVTPEPVDLRAVVGQVSDEARSGNPDRAIDVDVRGEVHGTWDRGRVTQALSNLVSNAITYGDPRTPVGVFAEVKDTDAFLRVTNRGPAIPPDQIPTLFEPFQPAADDKRRLSDGLGLGLYIVKEIAQAHGGSIEVASSAEDGTAFTLRLPRTPRTDDGAGEERGHAQG
jgi:signal transduction histidine kinase